MSDEIPFFSYDELVILAEKAVEKRGFGYVYPSTIAIQEGKACTLYGGDNVGGECVYMFSATQPGCLVGEIMYTANLIEGVPEWNGGLNIKDIVDSELAPFRTTVKGEDFLMDLQRLQDRGQSWGNAVSLAKEAGDRGRYREEAA